MEADASSAGKGYGGGGGGDSHSARVEATAAASFEENAGAPPVGYLEEVVMLDVRGNALRRMRVERPTRARG